MIVCNNISKNYDTQVVLKSFSYEFKDSGFYLLFGESGSGKTTFLNILSGFIPFDSGIININGRIFSGSVDKRAMEGEFDYITQDTFFVDFVTVRDNLRMIEDDEDKIKAVLDKVGLSEKAMQYPATLSGGEKQRLALARSLLGEKKILFLDEPTASLDEDNKRTVFKALGEIKNDILIICSSHDAEAVDYADEVIRFEKCHETCTEIQAGTLPSVEKQKRHPAYYIRKWFRSKSRNRKSGVLFGIFLTIAICICALADIPRNKTDSNIEYLYKVNMCKLGAEKLTLEELNELYEMEGVIDVVLNYQSIVPPQDPVTYDGDGEPIWPKPLPYTDEYRTLPYDADTFRLSDRIKYGTYFTDVNQVILMADVAEDMSPGSPESLIGQTYTEKLYCGSREEALEVELEIVGIFDSLNDMEAKYFEAIGILDEDRRFLNSKFMQQYTENEELYNSLFCYNCNIYFDSYKSMKNFYNENYQAFRQKRHFLYLGLEYKLNSIFGTMFELFLPMAVFIAFFTVLFYVNLLKTELSYNNKFISVFEYAGYPVKKVIRCFAGMNILYLLRTCLIASTAAFIITYAVNLINQKYIFIYFQIFTYNVPMLLGFIAFICLVSVISVNVILGRLKFTGWYENIISNRDLM